MLVTAVISFKMLNIFYAHGCNHMLNIFYGCMCHNIKHILSLNIHVYSDINLSDIDIFGVLNSDTLLIHKQYKNYVPQRFACAW